MMSFHKQKEKAGTKQAQNNKTNRKTQPQTKNTDNKKQWNESILRLVVKRVVTRQLVCLVPSRSSIEATKGQSQKHHRMSRQVPSKKVAMPKPGIPPARIPEIAMRGRAGMTSTNAHRSRRYAGRVKKTRVKRQ